MTTPADDRARLAAHRDEAMWSEDFVDDLLRMAEDGIAAREALAAGLAVWQPHLEAVPLGLPCQCVGCDMGRAITGEA